MDDRFDDLVDVNRRFWDASTPRKMETGSYLLDDFREGNSTLFAHEQEELGDVTGKSLLHLQCNNGLETLSLARAGADAVGIDISGESIRYGRELAAETGIDATFVQCDVYDVPAVLDESFDVVYTSRGVLVWLPELGAWAEVIADALTDDGVFYLYEAIPLPTCSMTSSRWMVPILMRPRDGTTRLDSGSTRNTIRSSIRLVTS